MKINYLSLLTSQNTTFQAKRNAKALAKLRAPREYIGKDIKKSIEELKVQLTKLNERRIDTEIFLRQYPDNEYARYCLDCIKSKITKTEADLSFLKLLK